MKVKDCNLIVPLSADENETVFNIAKKLREKKVRQFTIVKNNKPVGILSAVDIVNKVVAEAKDPKKLKAKDIMTTPIFFCHSEDPLLGTYFEMSKKNIISCPVIDGDKFIGTMTFESALSALTSKNQPTSTKTK